MTYYQVKNLYPEDFKWLCGVRPETFNQMVELLKRIQQFSLIMKFSDFEPLTVSLLFVSKFMLG